MSITQQAHRKEAEQLRFKRVLIANRGEIAVRISRSLRELGLESVAIYSQADANSMHRSVCDYAVCLPGNTAAETYLNIPLIVQAIQASGAQAVHPGYGFLSESPEFAQACFELGVTFIGPTAKAMQLMGNKIEAKNFMRKHDIPTVPGVDHPLGSVEALHQAAQTSVGFPLILKAAAGGGGRGMRIVRTPDELETAFLACKREAKAYFGNDDVFCERYIEHPRHIEFQVLVDENGHGVHAFERDCSIQRRHQKLIEEAPSQYLSEQQRERLGALAVKASLAAGYSGVGTVEFICESPDKAYFMEMNTRIQVEHPVTEMITGLDLIKEQIQVAQGQALSVQQSDIKVNGWSFEARINAEDSENDFRPSPGQVSHLQLPNGPFVRVDTHLYPGYTIPEFYDSMIAKVITWGRDRQEAMIRLERALSELEVEGMPTTTPFHERLLAHPKFQEGAFSTRFLEEHADYLAGKNKDAHSQDQNSPSKREARDACVLSGVLGLAKPQRQAARSDYEDDRQLWQASSRKEVE